MHVTYLGPTWVVYKRPFASYLIKLTLVYQWYNEWYIVKLWFFCSNQTKCLQCRVKTNLYLNAFVHRPHCASSSEVTFFLVPWLFSGHVFLPLFRSTCQCIYPILNANPFPVQPELLSSCLLIIAIDDYILYYSLQTLMVGQCLCSYVTCFRRTFSIRPLWLFRRPFAKPLNFRRCPQVRDTVHPLSASNCATT